MEQPGVQIELAAGEDVAWKGLAPGRVAEQQRQLAMPEIVVDGETGLLVAPGDERAVAVALKLLLADRDLRGRMGRQARSRAAQIFDFRQGLRALEDLYCDVVARGPGSPA